MYEALLPFSYLWMLVAALLGLRLGIRSLGFNAEIDRISERGDLAAYHSATTAFNRNKTIHAHTFLFAVVGAVSFFALGHSTFGDTMKGIVAAGIMLSSCIWTVAAIGNVRPAMGLADFILLFAIATGGYGLLEAYL